MSNESQHLLIGTAAGKGAESLRQAVAEISRVADCLDQVTSLNDLDGLDTRLLMAGGTVAMVETAINRLLHGFGEDALDLLGD